MISLNCDELKFSRQLGILDQEKISCLKLKLLGCDESILSFLVQLDQLGACRFGKGRVVVEKKPDITFKINLMKGFTSINGSPNWNEVADHFCEQGLNVQFNSIGDETSLILKNINQEFEDEKCDYFLIHGAGSAVCGHGQIPDFDVESFSPTLIDTPILIAGTSAVLHKLLLANDIFWEEELDDIWVSINFRKKGKQPTELLNYLHSEELEGNAVLSSDYEASVARFRVPMDSVPSELYSMVKPISTKKIDELTKYSDVGLFPAITESGTICFQDRNLPQYVAESNIVVLGAGGLGSWAIPSIVSGINLEKKGNLSIIDGDKEIEIHNLNRQVLYTRENVGLPKSPSAENCINSRFGSHRFKISGICSNLTLLHTGNRELKDNTQYMNLDEIGNNDEDDKKIINALKNMDIALSCLDNQFARTILNKACLEASVPMINGGGEGSEGIVEVFDNRICMTCQYGFDESIRQDVVSCQEDAKNVVNSIVTTTAYIGAMQAATALCILAVKESQKMSSRKRLEWYHGLVMTKQSARLPWFSDECLDHISV